MEAKNNLELVKDLNIFLINLLIAVDGKIDFYTKNTMEEAYIYYDDFASHFIKYIISVSILVKDIQLIRI